MPVPLPDAALDDLPGEMRERFLDAYRKVYRYASSDQVEMVNLRLGFMFDRINSELTFWGRNITDERWYHGSFDQPIGLGRMNSYPAEPATYGVTWQSNFD